ncbi:hypothetical protein LMIY3S_00078 [Labrys miyagiensis]
MIHFAPAAFWGQHALICLPHGPAVVMLNTVLTDAGFAVTTTRNLPEFEDAIRFGHYGIVVTVAALIGPIRAICGLPVIDVHPDEGREEVEASSQFGVFEPDAFLQRVSSVVNADLVLAPSEQGVSTVTCA